jgi:hypothetical protein
MIFFLRTQKNETIADIELYIKTEYKSDGSKRNFLELRSVIMIDVYSKFLLDNTVRAEEIIPVFDNIQELRGWLWEEYFMVKDNDGSDEDYTDVMKRLRNELKYIADKFNLIYVED